MSDDTEAQGWPGEAQAPAAARVQEAAQAQQQWAAPAWGAPSGGGRQWAAPAWGAPSGGGRANVLGIVALALLALNVLVGAMMPLAFRQVAMTSGDYGAVSLIFGVISGVLLVAALGLAIAGVLQKQATRFRWTAIGALVAAAFGIVGYALNLLMTGLMSVLPY